jgi:hypothetical protein
MVALMASKEVYERTVALCAEGRGAKSPLAERLQGSVYANFNELCRITYGYAHHAEDPRTEEQT